MSYVVICTTVRLCCTQSDVQSEQCWVCNAFCALRVGYVVGGYNFTAIGYDRYGTEAVEA